MYQYSVESMSGQKSTTIRTVVVFQKGRAKASHLLSNDYESVSAADEYGKAVIGDATYASQQVLQVCRTTAIILED